MIAEKIRLLRSSKGLTKKTVAEKLFITPNAFAKWENGETRIKAEDIDKLCEIFEVNPGYFYDSSYANWRNTASNSSTFLDDVKNYYPNEKELFQQLLATKDEVIAMQTKAIQSLEKKIATLDNDIPITRSPDRV